MAVSKNANVKIAKITAGAKRITAKGVMLCLPVSSPKAISHLLGSNKAKPNTLQANAIHSGHTAFEPNHANTLGPATWHKVYMVAYAATQRPRHCGAEITLTQVSPNTTNRPQPTPIKNRQVINHSKLSLKAIAKMLSALSPEANSNKVLLARCLDKRWAHKEASNMPMAGMAAAMPNQSLATPR